MPQWLSHFPAKEWAEVANAQKDKLVQEVEHLASEIMARISEAPIFDNREQLIHEARHHLETLIRSVRRSKQYLLGFFNISTRNDLTKLERKLSKIEARVETLQQPH